MTNQNIPLVLLLVSSVMAGCVHAPPTTYQWGSYEEQIYAMYVEPEKVPIESQLQSLESDYQKIKTSNGLAPPGLNAHLGFLYFQTGKPDLAIQSFEAEKLLFPESSVFMDRLIARVKH